ncbi:unnamed protein product, partial [Symbiodinium microadriaticum]
AARNAEPETSCMQCGNVYMADALYCRNCGLRRQARSNSPSKRLLSEHLRGPATPEPREYVLQRPPPDGSQPLVARPLFTPSTPATPGTPWRFDAGAAQRPLTPTQ